MFRYAVSLSGVLHLTQPGIPPLVLIEANERYDPLHVWANRSSTTPTGRRTTLMPRPRISAGRGCTSPGRPGSYDHATPGNAGTEAQEIVCGSTTMPFVKRLKRLGVPATTHVYKDCCHDWTTWRPEPHRARPLMLAAVGALRTGAVRAT